VLWRIGRALRWVVEAVSYGSEAGRLLSRRLRVLRGEVGAVSGLRCARLRRRSAGPGSGGFLSLVARERSGAAAVARPSRSARLPTITSGSHSAVVQSRRRAEPRRETAVRVEALHGRASIRSCLRCFALGRELRRRSRSGSGEMCVTVVRSRAVTAGREAGHPLPWKSKQKESAAELDAGFMPDVRQGSWIDVDAVLSSP